MANVRIIHKITNNEFKISNVWLAIENIAPAKPPAKFLPSCHKSPAKQLLARGLAGPPAAPYHGVSPVTATVG